MNHIINPNSTPMKKHFFSLFVIAALLFSVLTTCKKDVNKDDKKDVRVTHVTLNKNSLTLEVGGTETLIATVFPENATNTVVTWTSSDLETATVAQGKISAKEVGTATITVVTQDGNYKAKCVVTVVPVTPEEAGVIINGIKWATRNVAAHGKFVEKPEDLGALFQWGRAGDGHEKRTSLTYPISGPFVHGHSISGDENFDVHGQIVNTHPAYGKFILIDFWAEDDWRTPSDNALWNSGSETAPVKTANDPCPDGWRLPTKTELATLDNGVWTDSPVAGCFFGSGDNLLFLPAANWRTTNSVNNFPRPYGIYWSSSIIYYWGIFPYSLCFSDNQPTCYVGRAAGCSVRCVAE
jgi:hypothetical protein